MARPMKNNCDYFPHFTSMRNHKKVKALRAKFGQVLGYAFWSMILEYLTEQDGIEFENSDLELEMFAGELGVSATEIRDIIDYCIKIELLFLNSDNFIYSDSLNELLQPVFDKRKKAKEASKARQRHKNGSFCGNNTQSPLVSATEIPQSKVKKSKVKKSKENNKEEEIPIDEIPIYEKQFNYLEYHTYYDLVEHAKKEESWFNSLLLFLKLEKETILSELENFPVVQEAKGNKTTNLKDFKNHFFNYMNLRKDDLRKVERKKSEISIVDRLEIERQKYFEILKKEQNGNSKSTSV